MSVQKTNYKARQRAAKKSSQKLFVMFFVITAVTSVFYGGMAYSIARFLGLGFPFIGGAIVSIICLIIINDGYYIEHKRLNKLGAVGLAGKMGGEMLVNTRNFYDQQVQNIVEEMSIASGLDKPHLLIARNNQSINAFVTCDRDGENFAVTVTQGALRYLNREELQALIAHEFGHIKNGDVLANMQLSATLHGFFVLSELVAPETEGYDDFDGTSNLFGNNNNNSDGSIFGVLGLVAWIVTSIMILFGRVLQAAFSRERERLADAHAVEYTRNSSALVSVFIKIMALQREGVRVPKTKRDQGHFFFFDYKQNWATHPPLSERIQSYGYMPSESDIEMIMLSMENKAQQKMSSKKKYTNEYDDETGLSLVVDPNEIKRPDTAKEAFEEFLPLMMLSQYKQVLEENPQLKASDAINQVLAHFIHYSDVSIVKIKKKFSWSDKRYQAVIAYLNDLQEKHHSTHLSLFLQALNSYDTLTVKQKNQLLKIADSLANADKELTWHEACMLLCLRVASLDKTIGSDSITMHQNEITFLLQVMANISSDFESKKMANYSLLVDQVMPTITEEFVLIDLDTPTIQKLMKTIVNLQAIKPVFLKDLVRSIEKNMYLDNRASVLQSDMLETLKRVLAT